MKEHISDDSPLSPLAEHMTRMASQLDRTEDLLREMDDVAQEDWPARRERLPQRAPHRVKRHDEEPRGPAAGLDDEDCGEPPSGRGRGGAGDAQTLAQKNHHGGDEGRRPTKPTKAFARNWVA
jgi:hypothetical protein